MYICTCTCILGEDGLTGVPGCLGEPSSFAGIVGRLTGLEEDTDCGSTVVKFEKICTCLS